MQYRAGFSFIIAVSVLVLLAGCGARRGDLLLINPAVGPDPVVCSQDERGNLLIEITNPGSGQTIATTTRVEFPNRPPYLLPTRPLARQASVQLLVPAPEDCQEQPCRVVIVLDVKEEVEERDEQNNQVEFHCRMTPFRLLRP